MNRRLHYLCLQATRQGQASYAHVHEIIKGLTRFGWDVKLFEPRYGAAPGRIPTYRKILEFARVQLECYRSLAAARILYIRDHPAALPSILLARRAGLTVVLEVNGAAEELLVSFPRLRWIRPLVAWQYRLRCRLATGLIANTRELAAWLREEGIRDHDMVVINNGADPNHFTPQPDMSESSDYVVFFGALAAWQGVDTILEAVRKPEWPQSLRLVIAGDGAERQKVVEASGESPLIDYVGRVSYERIPDLVSRSYASLVVKNLTAAIDGVAPSPLKLYESMSAGVPVIVSDIPGIADMVRDTECGVVVPPGDPSALAATVADLVAHPAQARRMGLKGRDAVLKRFSWAVAAGSTHDFLMGLAEGVDVDGQQ